MWSLLSKTIKQTELDTFLNDPQQQSMLRLKQNGAIDDSHMDAHLHYISTLDTEEKEYLMCKLDIIYFCTQFCKINDPVSRKWILFNLWPKQLEFAQKGQTSKFLAIAKTRQFGASWYFQGVKPLHDSIYDSNSISLLYSLTDEDAVRMLKPVRVRGMLQRLPPHIMGGVKAQEGNRHEIPFTNGSMMYGLNPDRGRGQSGTYCVVDEADFMEDLNSIFDKVESAVNAGGRIVLVSTSNKEEPNSVYKNIFRSSWDRESTTVQAFSFHADWQTIFIPWNEHPERDRAWYDAKSKEILDRTGSLDELWANYPETLEQAFAPAQTNKRLPVTHLQKCKGVAPLIETNFKEKFSYPSMRVYQMPDKDRKYYIGVDTAEGLDQPNTDYSSTIVIDDWGEEVCNITGKYDPTTQATIVRDISNIYHKARAMIENNSYGFHVIQWLKQNGARHLILKDPDTNKDGWNTNAKSKAALYVNLAKLAMEGTMKINDPDTFRELQSINKDTLKAPKKDHDDRAMAFGLAQIARIKGKSGLSLKIFNLEW